LATPAPAEERMIWTDSPSQWLNFRSFLVSGMVMLVLIAAAVTVSRAGPAAVGGYQTPALVALAVLLLAVVLQPSEDTSKFAAGCTPSQARGCG